MNRPKITDLARQCAAAQQNGVEIIVCSSGAIAAGRERLAYPDLPATIAARQMLAAVGQSYLMQLWTDAFGIYDVNVAQMLLTGSDIRSRERYLNARDTLTGLLDHNIVPIINENDSVATEEIKVGDNDNLGAMVAILGEADLLILLTDQEGLFTADPRKDSSAEIIPVVHSFNDWLWQIAGGSGTGLGTGGMMTKLESAEKATRAGVEVIIANGNLPQVLTRLLNNEPLGTRFTAHESPLENRKRRLLVNEQPAGTLTIDAGAANALRQNGRSLLPIGITLVEGSFPRGATVTVQDTGQTEIARGIVRYSSTSLQKIMGCNSAEIEPTLGYTHGKTAIHRNDLILL